MQEKKKMREKKKIIIDLDVVTVAKWDKSNNGDLGRSFIIRVEKGEFEVYTPYSLQDLLDKWRYIKLRDEIKEFYELYSKEIITAQNLTDKIDKLKVDEGIITNELKQEQIKEEDILLVIATSVFRLDFLVTLNRKHLKNKKEVINSVLQKYKLGTIKIVSPDEI